MCISKLRTLLTFMNYIMNTTSLFMFIIKDVEYDIVYDIVCHVAYDDDDDDKIVSNAVYAILCDIT